MGNGTIKSMEVVTASGSLVYLSAESVGAEAELWKAMRQVRTHVPQARARVSLLRASVYEHEHDFHYSS